MWLDKALARGYITKLQYKEYNDLADEVGRLLYFMEHNPDHYANKSTTK